MKNKLYVWTGFSPDYSNGLAFAIAPSLEAAKEQIIKAYGYNPHDWGELEIRNFSKCAYCVSGGA